MGWRNWAPGEPNSGTTSSILFQNSYFSAENYYWDDWRSTSDAFSFVCEKDRRKENNKSVKMADSNLFL